MRTFIAIELPKEIKDSLAQLQEELKKTGADVKWVKPENIHLTLKFLGEINNKKLEKITEILWDVAKNKDSFSIRLSSIGTFPVLSSPRVIWVGIDMGGKESEKIAWELEKKIARIGIPKEKRPFSSHITIGRTRSTQGRDNLIQELKNLEGNFRLENSEFLATKITFFKSTLTPTGPIYESLQEANLNTT